MKEVSIMVKRNIVITGASDGIGAAAVHGLIGKDYNLFLVGRNEEKTAKVAKEAGAQYFLADFAKLKDVRNLAEKLNAALGDEPIHVLANNAGGIFGPGDPTIDGYEKTFQVNYLAPFLLTQLLLPKLIAGKASVINTSSVGHRIFGNIDLDDLNNKKNYKAQKAYGDAKLEDILFANELNRRYHDQGISAVSFHPGNIRTNFANDRKSGMHAIYHTFLNKIILSGPQTGGNNLRFFIEGVPGSSWKPGSYYDQRKLTNKVNPQVNDEELQRKLWDKSLKLVSLTETV